MRFSRRRERLVVHHGCHDLGYGVGHGLADAGVARRLDHSPHGFGTRARSQRSTGLFWCVGFKTPHPHARSPACLCLVHHEAGSAPGAARRHHHAPRRRKALLRLNAASRAPTKGGRVSVERGATPGKSAKLTSRQAGDLLNVGSRRGETRATNTGRLTILTSRRGARSAGRVNRPSPQRRRRRAARRPTLARVRSRG
jgi:hypothetical protein